LNKIVGIMQPTYLPWIGYFEMIDVCDIFVFLDDVQFQRKSWQQRNVIKGTNGPILLTVPVFNKGKRFQKIEQVIINNNENWARQHLKSINMAYSKSYFYKQYWPAIALNYGLNYDLLVDLNISLISKLMELFNIRTPTIRSSSLKLDYNSNEKIVAICQQLKANELYDAAGAVKFIDATIFQNANIDVIYQDYHHPKYNQLHGEFISHMSVVDLLFNEGPRSLDIIRSGSSRIRERGSALSRL